MRLRLKGRSRPGWQQQQPMLTLAYFAPSSIAGHLYLDNITFSLALPNVFFYWGGTTLVALCRDADTTCALALLDPTSTRPHHRKPSRLANSISNERPAHPTVVPLASPVKTSTTTDHILRFVHVHRRGPINPVLLARPSSSQHSDHKKIQHRFPSRGGRAPRSGNSRRSRPPSQQRDVWEARLGLVASDA